MDNIRYKEAFLLFDQNKSGSIEVKDLPFVLRALGLTPTEADLKRIDEQLIDGQQIDYLQFVQIVSNVSLPKYSAEQIRNAFVAFDPNRYGEKENDGIFRVEREFSGLINVETFKTALMTMGEPLSEEEMNEMLKDFPIDDDG